MATSIRSIRSLAPLLDRVLVQRIKAETKTAGGIFLPESSVEKLNEGKVLAVGPGALDKKGNRMPMGVAIGDRVLIPSVGFLLPPLANPELRGMRPGNFAQWACHGVLMDIVQYGGSPVKAGEEEYQLFRDSEILAKINE
ncbi:mitochondrial chaperonin Cpn10 homeolog b [Epichloe bromicola]|uniref:Mitochondrial chaperonin Cpn10 homeolog b n=1 Tax=Epichloe bromicola TaxID=79588 RepID=A0ABQ0CW85_9HYPO